MNILFDGPEEGPLCIFAHGAGAPMDSGFMDTFTKGLSKKGIRVARFEFPYMQERRETGKKRPPNRQPELLDCLDQVITEIGEPAVLIGKSMGGRMSSIASSTFQNEADVNTLISGVCAIGYPFHPQGKPEKLRVDHLSDVSVPMSVIQGTRDPLGNQELVSELITQNQVPQSMSILWLEDGDHDLKPRKKSGYTHDAHIEEAIDYCASFIKFCYSARNK